MRAGHDAERLRYYTGRQLALYFDWLGRLEAMDSLHRIADAHSSTKDLQERAKTLERDATPPARRRR